MGTNFAGSPRHVKRSNPRPLLSPCDLVNQLIGYDRNPSAAVGNTSVSDQTAALSLAIQTDLRVVTLRFVYSLGGRRK